LRKFANPEPSVCCCFMPSDCLFRLTNFCPMTTTLQVEKICKVANKPLVVTYTGLIQTCIDNGGMENAKYIFNHMCNYCSPNTVTCNIMLKSYIKHGMLEDAKDLLHDILNCRIRSKADSSQVATADKFTFNTFMEACAAAKRWNDFEYAFREMLLNGYHFDERRHLRMVLDAYRHGKVLTLATITCRSRNIVFMSSYLVEQFICLTPSSSSLFRNSCWMICGATCAITAVSRPPLS
jgi:pentatricopeptide repeat protein